MSAEQAQRRRQHANQDTALKLKGVRRPNEKRRAVGDKRPWHSKRRKTGKMRLQLLDWSSPVH